MIQRRNALRKKSARKPKKTSPVQRKTSSSLSNQVLPQRAQTPLPTVLQSMQILTNIPSPPTILNAQALRSTQKQVATNPPTRSRRRITLSLPLSHNHKRPTPFNPVSSGFATASLVISSPTNTFPKTIQPSR